MSKIKNNVFCRLFGEDKIKKKMDAVAATVGVAAFLTGVFLPPLILIVWLCRKWKNWKPVIGSSPGDWNILVGAIADALRASATPPMPCKMDVNPYCQPFDRVVKKKTFVDPIRLPEEQK